MIRHLPRPREDLAWFHFWFSTFGTWLRGDVRGFRDHDHRIHSSGDYKDPPPESEHEGLRRWVQKHMHKAPVHLPPALRQRTGQAIICEAERKDIPLLALAVMSDHVHGIGRFPTSNDRALVGRIKIASSHSIRDEIPGAVWAKKCKFKAITSKAQQVDTFRYIEHHVGEGAWVRTFRSG